MIGVFGMGHVGIPAALLFADVLPGLTRDLDAVLADVIVVFAGHKKYRSLVPAELKAPCRFPYPANHCIGKGDKNGYDLIPAPPTIS